jgi:hypothetical protein
MAFVATAVVAVVAYRATLPEPSGESVMSGGSKDSISLTTYGRSRRWPSDEQTVEYVIATAASRPVAESVRGVRLGDLRGRIELPRAVERNGVCEFYDASNGQAKFLGVVGGLSLEEFEDAISGAKITSGQVPLDRVKAARANSK